MKFMIVSSDFSISIPFVITWSLGGQIFINFVRLTCQNSFVSLLLYSWLEMEDVKKQAAIAIRSIWHNANIGTELMVPENLCVKGIIESKKSTPECFSFLVLSLPLWATCNRTRVFFFVSRKICTILR